MAAKVYILYGSDNSGGGLGSNFSKSVGGIAVKEMNVNKKNILITLCIVTTIAFATGCKSAGALASLGTERDSEKITRAEFNLGETEGKIVVFISQPGWIKTPMDLRVTLTNSFNRMLEEKAGIKKERLTEYADVLKIRMEMPEDKRNNAIEVASKLGAQYVLAVQIMDFDISTFSEENFFSGQMITRTCLDNMKGEKLWPIGDEGCKEITIGFETEAGTLQSSVEKLSNATAYCVIRYLYDCKTANFRIPEEQKELDSYTW
ncbi:MAG: hypothetical protein WC496_01535 [Phycisphaerae bacterium]